ncbi:hypothetical protein BT63DRAFT_473972 [Microthyrium microscopicum]|uniref:Uncharacterized protein n=1 Tax=Microthyrium microscopicum TaxID=703497 RepID=A0A6A6UR05_9PEZI|nr:hypothetical protein BT63DRAFT_473972 [Microthyrium microscopicum]
MPPKTPYKKPTPKSVPVQKTTLPYSAPTWPTIHPKLQQDLLTQLREIVGPLGAWRAKIILSKGKRKRRRERKLGAAYKGYTRPRPPVPKISRSLTVGFNSTTRALEGERNNGVDGGGKEEKPVRVVFVTHSVDSMLYAHLPVLTSLARPAVQLVPLSEQSEKNIGEALGVPRVGMIGIREDAPGAIALFELLKEVPAVEVPFLKESASGKWLGTKIDTSMSMPENS